jgi:hypothetical protein
MGGNIRLYFLVRCRGDFPGDEKYHVIFLGQEIGFFGAQGGCRWRSVQVSADFDSAAVFFSLVILLREKTPKVPQNLHCPALLGF